LVALSRADRVGEVPGLMEDSLPTMVLSLCRGNDCRRCAKQNKTPQNGKREMRNQTRKKEGGGGGVYAAETD
jgi:hypothetical protein